MAGGSEPILGVKYVPPTTPKCSIPSYPKNLRNQAEHYCRESQHLSSPSLPSPPLPTSLTHSLLQPPRKEGESDPATERCALRNGPVGAASWWRKEIACDCRVKFREERERAAEQDVTRRGDSDGLKTTNRPRPRKRRGGGGIRERIRRGRGRNLEGYGPRHGFVSRQ